MNLADLQISLASSTVRISGRNIFYAEAGAGAPLMMLHGGGPGASGVPNYERNIAELARYFRVIIPDMPGYGRSTKGLSRSDPFGDCAEAMLGLLDYLEIDRACVVGNSLGGACALRMALDRPRRVAGLVLMGPGGIDTTRSLPTAGLKCLLDYYGGAGPSKDKLTTFIRQYLVYDGARVPQSVIDGRFQASLDPEVVAYPPLVRPKGLPKFRLIDFTRDPRLSKLQTPTLVLWGTEDLVNRPSGAQSLQKRMPNCDAYLFSRTGHWVQWERAEEFNAAVTAFTRKQMETVQ
ncbi:MULTISPECIES: alpha/beta fold hydrolase [Cupriavidus]|uniref:alpha/beta fold hydrolase n=1 Tax=Cupriavidus TaxID=106589 RepID=UPI000E10917A|nr:MULTISPECIES: alpha/beta fold hydrolase [Cupriavidus]MBP0623222.1 alpha/beta fold hydrolase [Cupriavidus sp. LEh25]MDK2659916.1 alpha/beta fold hydrolase [Cupriavidus sp. LEh21]SOY61646.1 Alpha/beta hydrolase fold protein [Cupriavidus taiwanensis]SOY63059.1 Alpha/beta hydrolase fold protein [Cupriavidus taiwanensis]SOY98141.1 Alpha/beta hydrolase fold protein [Cupriavidus taiwanensis]